jgi:hypothetical protein
MMTEDEPGLPLGDANAMPSHSERIAGPLISNDNPCRSATGPERLLATAGGYDEDEDEDGMDWTNSEDIILREQRSIAVYRNPWGGVVIREEAGALDDEDRWLVLASEDAVRRLIAALQKQLKG